MSKYRALAVVMLCALFTDVLASPEWLLAQMQADGSIASNADTATPFQSTAEAVRSLRLLAQAANVDAPQAHLAAQAYQGTEYLSRKMLAAAEASMPVDALAAELLTRQNADGGFGEQVGYHSTALDTAFALEALASTAYQNHAAASNALAYLLQTQRSDGGWQLGDVSSDLYTTALAVRSLHPYRARFAGVQAVIASGNNFLLSRRGADALWGEDFASAQALLTLSMTLSDVSQLHQSEAALSARRLVNTSWSNDVYATALALRASHIFDARSGGSGVPTTGGAITGYVLRAGSSAAIEGATVSAAGAQVLTNSEGHFVLSGVPAGEHTLSIQKSGYNAATRAVTAISGQFSNAGTILLGQSVQDALVRGRIYDAHDLSALAGVTITLTGPASATVTSNAQGEFEIGGIAAGTYAVNFQRSGYYSGTGTLDAPSGSIASIQQGMTREGAYLDESPVTLVGRVVDGVTRLPVVNAQLTLDGAPAGSSQADGAFQLSAVERGNHRIEISASGYTGATYSFLLAPGAAGALGDLPIFAATPDSAASTLTLVGTVVNGLDNRPLGGATAQVVQTGSTTQTSDQGRFELEGLTLLQFDLLVSAPGHETRTFALSASGFGEVAGTFALPPLGGDPEATVSTLRGVVRDSVTSEPLANASVRVAGTTVSGSSGTDGSFELTGIVEREFTVSAALSGYSERRYDVKLSQHGVYSVDVTLTREPGAVTDLFDVVSVVPTHTNTGAHTQQRFVARIANLSDEARAALVIAEVFDASDESVATSTPFAVGTETPATMFNFAAGETLELTIPWNTAQFAPGSYRVRVRVVEPGTNTMALPGGVVLAQGETTGTVNATSRIGGGMTFDPPLAQAGSTQPVRLSAVLMNQGNVPLTGQAFSMSVLDPASGATLHTVQAVAAMLDVGNSTSLDFGTWVPTQTGDLPVTITAQTADVTGVINGVLYVGDKATGTFTVDRSVVPMGTQTVRASIQMRGVDVRTGTSTDPLFLAVREAVRKGGVYVAQQAPAWNELNRCLGCHIQTQSIMGLAASVDKADIDPAALKYLYNDIAGAAHGNGALIASHPEFSSVTNSLGVWSLSGWRDAPQVFRTMYRAASFQLSTMTTSGDQSYWTSNHCMGWWCNNEGPTMASTKGLTGLLRMSTELGSQTVTDYTLQPAHELGSANLMDFEQTADGTVWYVEYAGTLYARNLQTGERRTVATGITNAYGLAMLADNTAFVTSGSRIVRINPDGTRSDLVNVGGNANLLDIVLAADGFLYVADFNNHRILKVSQAGAFTVFASGGLMAQPVGLVFDEQNNLYVANYGRFNILRISPAGQVALFAPGLPYRPVWIRRSPDGAFYANSEHLNNQGFSPSGLWRIDADGVVERLVTMDSTNRFGYSALNFIDDELYLSHESSRRLYRVATQPLATPQLAQIPPALARIARFTIARHQTNSASDIHAMRLITLAEARPHVADPALVAQIDAAIAYIDNLLRQRQRPDGGWAYANGGTVSDPYTTAFVGLALEYTHPSVNDPVIRNSIAYLLNQQSADFSWPVQNNVFQTRLGPTSFVMAYLPLALERLGGIDTDLTVVMPPDIQLSNPSQAPASQTPVAAGTEYRWSMQGVTANARTVSFDATLSNMGYRETRPVAAAAYLQFSNSFTGETLRSDLEIPTVRAESDLVLSLSTGQSAYGAHSEVAISSVVTNAGPASASAQLRLLIRAPDGSIVAELPPLSVGALTTGESVAVPATWNTGALLAGGYQVYGQLFNSASVMTSEAVASFQVVHQGPVVSAVVAADKPVYQAWDSVQLTGRVRNASANVILADSIAELTVRSPAGEVIFTGSYPVSSMPPLTLRDVLDHVGLADAATGAYGVELFVRDAFSRALLATATTQFEVQRDELQALRGAVTVQRTQVERGASNVCTDSVTNMAASALPGVVLAQNLVDLDSGELLQSALVTRDFGGRQQHLLTRSIATGALEEGGYACVLTATYNGRTQQLGSVGFEVVQPAIRIDATLTSEGRGRLLVLMDEKGGWPCTPLREVELWTPFRTRLPADARVDVELLDDEGRRVDFESVALRHYRGTVNQRRGSAADLSIVGVSSDVLTLQVASGAGLGAGYRIVATASADSLPPVVIESNVMGSSCGWHAGIGARFGDFHCSGGRTRSGAGLPAPLSTSPTLAQQRAFLEERLDEQGWSYKIVTDDEAFERELRSGQYAQYALFSEHEKLDEQVQKELREAVYRGEGLLDAGQHDHRHHSFDAALGIKPVGHHSHAKSVTITSPWSTMGTVALATENKALRIRLEGAQQIARFERDRGREHDRGGHGQTEDAAATSYTYGRGKSVYVGYDLLAEATHAGKDSLHAQLLVDALAHVAPEVTTAHADGVVPLRLTIQNRATATLGRALLPLPAGVSLVDAGDAQVTNGVLSWSFELRENEQLTFSAWVRLPNRAGAVTFDAGVQSGAEPNFVDQAQPRLTLNAVERDSVADARATAQTSIRFLLVKFWLDKAQFWLDRGRPEFALASLVQASSEVIKVSHAQSQQLRWQIDDAIWVVGKQL
ncbi:carboxypeptidase regulatory-like domain-containing protein [Steroidobacter sp. S1-65]|uniref:Carboxypeptidase regulatory-like domain-containing protein n=1 Tax=Steroidobacter gossypii TaxID=2805490 RepID=A0ABS1WV71_9GAMM|nr:carboxypeptidase regulatory-like domain-containing protein [Steroidobacter gossypii]MBM0104868.1 carboxypeptidase regulatory-like domain-containing protein [Steroidobacter gossypii]